MPRYIDANKALEMIDEWLETVGYPTISKGCSYYYELQGCIEDTPTEDVQEVRHGHWIEINSEMGMYRCSQCREIVGAQTRSRFCPNCGAKMNEEEK